VLNYLKKIQYHPTITKPMFAMFLTCLGSACSLSKQGIHNRLVIPKSLACICLLMLGSASASFWILCQKCIQRPEWSYAAFIIGRVSSSASLEG